MSRGDDDVTRGEIDAENDAEIDEVLAQKNLTKKKNLTKYKRNIKERTADQNAVHAVVTKLEQQIKTHRQKIKTLDQKMKTHRKQILDAEEIITMLKDFKTQQVLEDLKKKMNERLSPLDKNRKNQKKNSWKTMDERNINGLVNGQERTRTEDKKEDRLQTIINNLEQNINKQKKEVEQKQKQIEEFEYIFQFLKVSKLLHEKKLEELKGNNNNNKSIYMG